MKNLLRGVALSSLLLSGASFADALDHHPNLRAAHENIRKAHEELAKAEDRKKTEFGGHRAKAEQLLNDAQKEIEEAAQYADSNAK